ncbi:MAG: hypothetical protein L6R39_006139 [Caloplaca ligustica]|nr:MAG: hypothetical protein L6R39_006139 [Caloplaca ligustica]
MDVADFAPVAEFLEYGEYNPSMVSVGTDHAYLNAVSSVREEEVIRCGVIFKIAQQLNLPGLQTLVLDKLKGLQPYPAYAFLVVARTAFGACLADDGLDKFLLEYLAQPHHHLPHLLEPMAVKMFS